MASTNGESTSAATSELKDPLLAEFAKEAETTRSVLQRIPEDRLEWKPHPKSMTLGALGLHVAMVPAATIEFLSEPVREVPAFGTLEAESKAQIMQAFEEGVVAVRTTLDGWSDEFLRGDGR